MIIYISRRRLITSVLCIIIRMSNIMSSSIYTCTTIICSSLHCICEFATITTQHISNSSVYILYPSMIHQAHILATAAIILLLLVVESSLATKTPSSHHIRATSTFEFNNHLRQRNLLTFVGCEKSYYETNIGLFTVEPNDQGPMCNDEEVLAIGTAIESAYDEFINLDQALSTVKITFNTTVCPSGTAIATQRNRRNLRNNHLDIGIIDIEEEQSWWRSRRDAIYAPPKRTTKEVVAPIRATTLARARPKYSYLWKGRYVPSYVDSLNPSFVKRKQRNEEKHVLILIHYYADFIVEHVAFVRLIIAISDFCELKK